jgi:acyl carrier protein
MIIRLQRKIRVAGCRRWIVLFFEERDMAPTVENDLETNESSPGFAKPFTREEDAFLRETLKRCSASTYEAACQFRKTGNIAHLPAIVVGVIERYVEPDLRAKLKEPDDDLRLREDLGIDSLTLIEIVMLAEEVLQISINEEPCRLRTLGDVRRFIECKLLGLPPMPTARLLLGNPIQG